MTCLPCTGGEPPQYRRCDQRSDETHAAHPSCGPDVRGTASKGLRKFTPLTGKLSLPLSGGGSIILLRSGCTSAISAIRPFVRGARRITGRQPTSVSMCAASASSAKLPVTSPRTISACQPPRVSPGRGSCGTSVHDINSLRLRLDAKRGARSSICASPQSDALKLG